MIRIIIAWLMVCVVSSGAAAQSAKSSWSRGERKAIPALQLFHSMHGINLPTAETLQGGDLEFGVSHRFVPFLKDGSDALWGFDGPAVMRLSLAYAPIDRLVVTLGRSNLDDNVDLKVKVRVLEIDDLLLPVIVAGQAGASWNTVKRPNRSRTDERAFQGIGQVIVNTMINDVVGIGVVPTYVRNSDIRSEEVNSSFAVGVNGQVYFGKGWSAIAEWIPVVAEYRAGHNVAACGLELETGGHFFKVHVSNSTRLNTAQVVPGTPDRVEDGELHFGFNITRLLSIL